MVVSQTSVGQADNKLPTGCGDMAAVSMGRGGHGTLFHSFYKLNRVLAGVISLVTSSLIPVYYQ